MQQLIEALLQCKDKKELALFLDALLTKAEVENLSNRYFILKELMAGTSTHREIAKKLGVSIFNVSRGANLLKEKGDTLKRIMQKPLM